MERAKAQNVPMPEPTPDLSTAPVLPDVRGAIKLAIDAVGGVTGIVESMHQRIASGAPPLGQVPDKRTRGITGFVYRTVRGTTSLVGGSLDLGLTGVEKLLGPRGPALSSPKRDAIVAAVNGVCGDHLERTGNPLALPLTVRPAAGFAQTPHLLVVVHGLCMTPAQWTVEGQDHGKRLATELGATPVYVGYNTGRHIGSNGAVLAAALQELVARWSVPVESITFLGHSMGGLVARSAVALAQEQGLGWPHLLRTMVFLGTPHHGAPLEQGGNWIHRALGVSPYLAPFTRLSGLRSEGISDLRDGNLQPTPPHGRFAKRAERAVTPLPEGVTCHAIAGTIGGALLGDGLVTVESALGHHADAARQLAIPPERKWVAEGVGHLGLLGSEAVFAQLRGWLVAPPTATAQPG